jgi:PAS domain S-box-containing protein
MKKRLALVISAPLLLAALLSAGLIYLIDVRNATQRIESEALEHAKATLTHLQNILNTQLASGNMEDARLSMSVSAMHTGLNTLLLSDEQDRIMLANRYIWEGEPATIVGEYDVALARQVRLVPAPLVGFSAQGDRLRGYYPVTIRIAERELGLRKHGVLFFEFDISAKLANAQREAALYSLLFGSLLLLSAILVSLLLRKLVSGRIHKLVEVTQKFARGELSARAAMQGSDEIAFLGSAFNAMAEQREKVEQTLASDIFERKQIEVELRQERDFAAGLVNTAPMIVLLLGTDAAIQHVNPYFENLTGYRLDEIRGKDWFGTFLPERARDDVRAVFQKVLTDVRTRGNINPVVTRSGEEIVIEWNSQVMRDAQGAITGVLAIGLVVSEREAAEKLLRVSEERLNEAQHLAQVGSWELDLLSGKLSWSDEIFNLFEIDKTKFGATYEAFLNGIHPEDRDLVNQAYTNSLVTRAPYEVTHRLKMGDGRIKWVQERCSSEFDAAGKPLRSVGTVQDISAIKQAQVALEQLNDELEERVVQRTHALQQAKEEAEAASRSKSLFLTSMSHELRTPLNAILGYAQLMEITPGLPEDMVANAHEIKRAGDLLLALMNDILDLARIESGRLDMHIENVSLVEVLAECNSQNMRAAEMRGIQFVHDNSCEQLHVKADRRRLVQVLNNLISNAIKYNSEGGTVTVSCAPAASGQIRVAVTDTGLGIAADRLAQLFQPFNRLGAEMGRIEGTGIGLVITRRLLEDMGGRIGVDSIRGHGSTFWFELPVADEFAAVPVPLTQPVAAVDRKPRILVAEDYLPNQNILRLQLQSLGCNVDMVANGAEALESWRAHRPDLILTDLNMPSMDGTALARAVRAEESRRGGHTPIVAITAAAVRSEKQRCRDAGMDDVLTKPIALEGLRGILTRWLELAVAVQPAENLAAAANNDAILDFNYIYRILGQANPAQACSLVATFIQSASKELEKLAGSAQDSLLVAREMHKQKSSARTAGALRYARLAEALEQRIHAGDTTAVSAALAALKAALSAVAVALSQSADVAAGAAIDAEMVTASVAGKCSSVLVVDDDAVVLQQMSNMLATLGVPEVLTAGNGLEAIRVLAARGSEVEVLVCDLNMPEMDGVELIRRFAQTGFSGGLILMSGADEKVLSTVSKLAVLQGLRVLGQLHKPVSPAQISELLAHNQATPTQKLKAYTAPEVTAESIREGMANNEFGVWLQPKVDSASLAPVGLEALARWRRRSGEFIPPDIFIAVAEQSGLIEELSQLLVSMALTEGARVFEAGFPLKIAINLSGRWLNDLNLPDYVYAKTRAAGLKADDVMLEVTETGVMEDLTTALDVLTRLRLKGFGLSIDDFGIGYSSFEQLVRIPFTEMKLDRSFVCRATQDGAARAILESSMDMARKLELSTVAEGVETAQDLELVRTLGCDRVQGYLIARPMPVDVLLAWLNGEKNRA